MAKRKKTKGQTMIYKTLNRKLKIEKHELHNKNRGVWEGLAVPAPLGVMVIVIMCMFILHARPSLIYQIAHPPVRTYQLTHTLLTTFFHKFYFIAQGLGNRKLEKDHQTNFPAMQ
jgi:hypothetical protein